MEFVRGEHVYSYLKELEANQYRSKERIREIQKIKLHKLLDFVSLNNDYYIDKYKGFDVKNEFYLLPPLSKEELRNNFKKLMSKGKFKYIEIVETSGSTGIPLQFFRDRVTFGYTLASLYRARRWWGLDIGSMEAMLWGVPISAKAKVKAKIRDFLLNRFREREYNIDLDTLFEFYNKIIKKKPDYIFGYTSMVYEFALFVKGIKGDGNDLGLKAVICTAEKIYDYQRDTIQKVFGCGLISEYGATETGIISYECKEGANHISDDCVYVEIVDENNRPLPDGETGKVLVTVLNSCCLPVIRYDLGDIASKSVTSCSCGVNLSILEKIDGRTSDIVVTPEGRVFHSIIFYYIMKDFAEKFVGIKQFKVIQKQFDRLELHIVKDKDFSGAAESYLRNRVTEKLGDEIQLDLLYSDRIEREKSGKLRDFETKIDTTRFLSKLYSS